MSHSRSRALGLTFAVLWSSTSCSGPLPDQTRTGSAEPSTTVGPPGSNPSGSRRPGPDPPPIGSWFELTRLFPDQDSLGGFSLDVGILGASAAKRIDEQFGPIRPSARIVGALPFATGPVEGIVAYGFFDGSRSTFARVTIADGSTALLSTSEGVFHDAAIDSGSNRAYVIRLSAATRQPLAIDVVDLDGGAQMQIVDLSRGNQPRPQTVLRLFALTDQRLALLDCPTDRKCTLTTYDSASGRELQKFTTAGGDPVGIVDGMYITVDPCRLPCPVTAYDLSTGERHSIGSGCGRAVVAKDQGLAVVVLAVPTGIDCFQPQYAIQAFDPTGRPRGPAIRLADRVHELASVEPTLGVSLSDGHVLLGVGGRIGASESTPPLIIRLRDGQRVGIP